MQEFWDWLATGSGSILLALLAGAGGSALLELLWRPRRDRRRAAALLLSEIALNTELLLLQAHARLQAPKQIPSDLRMSTIGWDAAADLVSELPPTVVRRLVTLYNRYDSLNRHIESFGNVLRERKLAAPGSQEAREAELMVLATLDVFNQGIDATIERGKESLRDLIPLAGWKESPEERAQVVDHAKVAAAHMDARAGRIAALKALFDRWRTDK